MLGSVFLLLVVYMVERGTCMSIDSVAYKFSDNGDSPMIEVLGSKWVKRQHAVSTLCYWVNRDRSNVEETVFVYKVGSENQFWAGFTADGKTAIRVNGSTIGAAPLPADGKGWLFICNSWSNTDGFEIFINGKSVAKDDTTKSSKLKTGGRIFLGQDPDGQTWKATPGKGFQGSLSEVNIVSYALNDNAVDNYYNCKKLFDGSVLSSIYSKQVIEGKVVQYLTRLPCGCNN